MRLPPWASFYQRSTYAELPDADLPNTPHELNPYERLWVRFAFAELKLLGMALALVPLLVLSWMAETRTWLALVVIVGPSALLLAYLCWRRLHRV